MSCLDIKDKIALAIDSLKITKEMLNEDNLRPWLKVKLEEDRDRLHKELRELYLELYKIILN